MKRDQALEVFSRLLAAYGPQHWWPADSPFEVMLGAVLTQNTSWRNVERALDALKRLTRLEAAAILALDLATLAATLRPVGYFNVKAQRLRAFCTHYQTAGGFAGLGSLETEGLRLNLLSVHGIGPETADDMLLYAFERPVFVVDAYTRRLFGRLGLLAESQGYEQIRRTFETALDPDVALFKEYHALIVRHGKQVCRTRPQCPACPLRGVCPTPLSGRREPRAATD